VESEAETLRAGDAGEAGGAGAPAPDGARRPRLLFANLALALVAYRWLLVPHWRGTLALDVESFLFLPAEGSALSVLLLSSWLLYRRRARLRALPRGAGAAAGAAGAALALAGVGVAAWAALSGVEHFLVVSLGLEALGFAVLRHGAAGARAVAVPVAFLAFALPLPAPVLNQLGFQLQLWTAQYTGWLLYRLGIPALVSGDQILRPSASFAVIENCSGLRSMETLSMLAVLMIDLFRRRGPHAALLFLLAPGVAFAMNGFRVLALILNPHSEVVAIHNLQGVAILLGGLVTLYGLDGALSRGLRRGGAPRVARASGVPGSRGEAPGAPGRAARLLPTGALAITAALTLLLRPWGAAPPPIPVLHHEIPPVLGEWVASDHETDALFLGGLGLRESIDREYRREGESVELFVALGSHAQGRRGPFSPKTALPGSGWVAEETWTAALARGGHPIAARVLRRETRRSLVYHWYEGTAGPADEVWRGLLALDRTPWRRRRDAAVVRLSTEISGPGPEARRQAEERMDRFLRLLEEPLARIDARLARKTFS